MKHTPGPWLAERHGQVTAVVAGHRRQVASTTGDAVMHGDPSADVISLQMANAALIAAAPELLDALVELSSIVEGVRSGDGGFDSFTLQPARAAIAAATGQVEVVAGGRQRNAGGSLFVAEKSPGPDECSICRGRHGREVTHACE